MAAASSSPGSTVSVSTTSASSMDGGDENCRSSICSGVWASAGQTP